MKRHTKCQLEWELIIPSMERISRRYQPIELTGKIEQPTSIFSFKLISFVSSIHKSLQWINVRDDETDFLFEFVKSTEIKIKAVFVSKRKYSNILISGPKVTLGLFLSTVLD